MSEIYDEMLELGRVIDDAGLDSAWVSEHHFPDDGYMPGVIPALGALAAVTSANSGRVSHSLHCTVRFDSQRTSRRST